MNSTNGAADGQLARGRVAMLALLRQHGIDGRVIDAMAAVPRERFVPDELRRDAYDDCALPIGAGQTISQPLIVAMMTEALALNPDDRVLEVGTGSGYQAAVLAQLARDVVTVERMPSLLAEARTALASQGYANVRAYEAGASLGWTASAPYDAILVAAAAPHIPRVLVDQLEDGGRLVMPVGTRRAQELVRATKTPHGLEIARLGACGFVPLISDEAFSEDDSADASRRFKVR